MQRREFITLLGGAAAAAYRPRAGEKSRASASWATLPPRWKPILSPPSARASVSLGMRKAAISPSTTAGRTDNTSLRGAGRRTHRRQGGCDRHRRHARGACGEEGNEHCAARYGRGRRSGRHRDRAELGAPGWQYHRAEFDRSGTRRQAIGAATGGRSQSLARRLFPQSGECISFCLHTAGARRGRSH